MTNSARLLLAFPLLVVSSPATADSSACAPQHRSCEAWHGKAFETTGENPEDFTQMKLACDAAANCERVEERNTAQAAHEGRVKREAAERAEFERREAERQSREAAIAEENQRQAVTAAEDAAQAKAARRPLAFSAAVCVYQERAKNARAARVTYTSGNISTTYNVSRADGVRGVALMTKRLRVLATTEHVRLLGCGNPQIRSVTRCVLRTEGCDLDVAADVNDLMNDVATAE